MRKLFYFNSKPKSTLWDQMWSSRTLTQELVACEIETAPRTSFLTFIPKNGKILDAGCGFGKWVLYLTRRGYNIIGLDNNELVIKRLKNYDNSLQVEFGDIQKLRYPDDHFDAYISMGVVEHFEEGPLSVLKEAYRVLKPGGLIFVSTPMVNIIRKIVIQPILNILLRLYSSFLIYKSNRDTQAVNNSKFTTKKKRKYYHFLEYRYSIKELKSFLIQSNFEVLKSILHDFHGSKDHCIGLGLDFPLLKARNGINFQLNSVGKLISRILEKISPLIASASVLCIGRSLKK